MSLWDDIFHAISLKTLGSLNNLFCFLKAEMCTFFHCYNTECSPIQDSCAQLET